MSRPKLRTPQQSLPVQAVLGLYEFLASLKLAVLLISLLSLVLAYGTFVEKWHGSTAAKFLIYGSPWFLVLNILLATNIFCAASIRFPWKRFQTGFVITHIGLLVLLFGCWMSWRQAVDAQMPILEGRHNSVAYDSASNVVDVRVERLEDDLPPEQRVVEVRLPFNAGPFNWQDYGTIFAFHPSRPFDEGGAPLSGWEQFVERLRVALGRIQKPEYFVSRDQGVLRDRSGDLARAGVKIESLDYYANSVRIRVPQLQLQVSSPILKEGVEPEGRFAAFAGVPSWQTVGFEVRSTPRDPRGEGQREMLGGGTIGFWLLGDDQELALFLEKPDIEDLGYEQYGQVILRADGHTHRFVLDDLLEQERMPLGDSGLEVELERYYANATLDTRQRDRVALVEQPTGGEDGRPARRFPAVELVVHKPAEGASTRLVLMADRPEVRVPPGDWKVYGSYWVDQGGLAGDVALSGQGAQRLDIVQGQDKQLYYRRWDRRQVSEAGPWPEDTFTSPLTGLEMAQAEIRVRLQPDLFHPSTTPGIDDIPQAFSAQDEDRGSVRRRAQFRVTVGDQSDTFWLVAHGLTDDMQWQWDRMRDLTGGDSAPLSPENRHTVRLGDRLITVTLRSLQFDVGRQIHLERFWQKLDPGSSQARYFGSVIHVRDEQGQTLGPNFEDVEVALNAPIDLVDPVSGNIFRLFQESRTPVTDNEGKRVFFSILTVNVDPGRGTKYLGCVLVVLGIAVMFYMKAYFFKRTGTTVATSKSDRPQPSGRQPPDHKSPKRRKSMV